MTLYRDHGTIYRTAGVYITTPRRVANMQRAEHRRRRRRRRLVTCQKKICQKSVKKSVKDLSKKICQKNLSELKRWYKTTKIYGLKTKKTLEVTKRC